MLTINNENALKLLSEAYSMFHKDFSKYIDTVTFDCMKMELDKKQKNDLFVANCIMQTTGNIRITRELNNFAINYINKDTILESIKGSYREYSNILDYESAYMFARDVSLWLCAQPEYGLIDPLRQDFRMNFDRLLPVAMKQNAEGFFGIMACLENPVGFSLDELTSKIWHFIEKYDTGQYLSAMELINDCKEVSQQSADKALYLGTLIAKFWYKPEINLFV